MKSPGEALYSSREKACLPMACEGGPDIRFSLTNCFVKNVEPVIDVQGETGGNGEDCQDQSADAAGH